MQTFSIWLPGFFKERPREDFATYDAKRGVFAVADGVGLWEGIEYVGKYPRISGAAKLSRAFVRTFVRYGVGHPSASLKTAFRAGNGAARKVNRGRSKYDAFRNHRGLFAATAAMATIRGRTLEWGHICDAGIMVLDPNGNVKLSRESCGRKFPFPRDIKRYGETTRTFFVRTLTRNSIDKKGGPMHYGVITGEPEAEKYLERGTLRLTPGDAVVLHTDGFSKYLELPEFRKLLVRQSLSGLKVKIEEEVQKKTARFRRMVGNHKPDGRESVEVIETQLQKLTGRYYSEGEYNKEKSLILVRT